MGQQLLGTRLNLIRSTKSLLYFFSPSCILCSFFVCFPCLYYFFLLQTSNYNDHVLPLQLDSWSVILNGSVEVTYPDSRTEILCMGNSFGVSPTMEKEYMKGVMKTKVDDCQVRSF